jgi:DNA-binding transcriptional regulator PaaX
MDFRQKYPLTAREAAYTPMVLHDGFGPNSPVPYPSLNGIRDFARYCGIRDGAVRTALSRGKSEGDLLTFTDDKKVIRYRIAGSQLTMGKTITDRQNQPEGFIVAVFSFTKSEAVERAKVRETLKYYGFKKLAQNTYINGRIDTRGLKQSMKGFGLENNLYLFHCSNVDDAELMEKILSAFEIEKRKKFLQGFHKDLAAFLTAKDLDRDEFVHRIFYAGPVYWTICYVEEPPFPASLLPKDYPLAGIIRLYEDISDKHRKKILDYYMQVNG